MKEHSIHIGSLAVDTPRAPAQGGARLGAALQDALSSALTRPGLAGARPLHLNAIRIDLAAGARDADIARAIARVVTSAIWKGQR